MTIDEAMTDLSTQLEVKRRLGKKREADAIGLGIQALKHTLFLRKCPKASTRIPLPGETKK